MSSELTVLKIKSDFAKPLSFLMILACFFSFSLQAQQQSVAVKRYIKPTFYFNNIRMPEKPSSGKLIDLYGLKQVNLGVFFPMYTSNWYKSDSITLASFHLLASAISNSTRVLLDAGNSESYRIARLQAGVSAFYCTGYKNIWFASVQPLISQDRNAFSKPMARIAAVFLLSRNVSPSFSYKIGFIRTFVWGDNVRNNLPIIGFRFGKLDKAHLNVILPRNISFNMPVGNKTWLEIFTKPIGGLHIISNKDSIISDSKRIALGRVEVLTGFGITYRPNSNVAFFANTGIAYKKRAVLIDEAREKYVFRTKPSIFLNLGLSLTIGRSKNIQNNFLMYDAMSTQNMMVGNNTNGALNNQIPSSSSANKINDINKIKLSDMKDFLTDEL
jgi:hypothetical protein